MNASANRRGWLRATGAALTTLWLAACDKIGQDPKTQIADKSWWRKFF